MKGWKKLRWMGIWIAIGLSVPLAATPAQEAWFFRIAGPVASKITGISVDGSVTWTNTPTNATFTVQTISSLTSPGWVDYIQVPVTNPVTTLRIVDPNPPSNMALIPAGSFTMGDTLDGDTSGIPLHTVYVSAFYMDRYEVTKALWDEIYSWAITHGYVFAYGAQGKSPNHPAHSMNWDDAVMWCNARSEKEGRTPAYYTSAAQTTVYRGAPIYAPLNEWVKWNSGYRLPTEAEWEKAARGGASGRRFPWGNTITHDQANYNSFTNYAYDISLTRSFHLRFATGNSPYTSLVGSFAANGYGLCDMTGNVWERCWDTFASYSSAAQTDPRGPSSGSGSVMRGGSWFGNANDARCARRNPSPESIVYLGFRCVLPDASSP